MQQPEQSADNNQNSGHRTNQLADGTVLEYTITTNDAADYQLFTQDLNRRLRSAQVHVTTSDKDRLLSRYRSFNPESSDHQSTTSYELPSGDVEVSIDASGPGSHGYLRYHTESAVAYTNALDIDLGRAGLFTAVLLSLALVSLLAGQLFLAAPALGAGLAMGLPAAVKGLAAQGYPISVTRWDVPVRQ